MAGPSSVPVIGDMATSVELSLSCKNLADMDVFSKSDPIVVVYERDPASAKWLEIGRTEIIWNNLNPHFAKKFVLKFHFEELQKMKFDVYDVDSKSPDLSKHDFLGFCETTLGEIVSSSRLEKKLTGGPRGNRGVIVLKAEEVLMSKDEITLDFAGIKLDRKDIFGSSDPFLSFLRVNEDGSRTVCHRTEVIKTNLNPHWKRFKVPVRLLCNGDFDRQIYIECYDWNKNGSHNLIGECNTSVRVLASGPNQNTIFELVHPKKKLKKKKYKNSGTLQLYFASVEEVPSFLDFIQGGVELNCSIAIDFTASNGNPTNPGTLHYMDPNVPSQYATALQSVGEIIKDYDSDNLFPALGFGARLPPNNQISHCFALNGDPANPFCQGIEGVLQAYRQCLTNVQLYGPTNFAPCINHVANMARQYTDGSQYFIHLILTDGIITDMPQTREAIVNAAGLPLSIIIVGIGDADFEAMDELDGDEIRLSYNGREAERDIVQFVPFRDFVNTTGNSNLQITKRLLAQAVLAEIPDQLVSYMRSKRIKPRQRQRLDSIASSSAGVNMFVEPPPPYAP